MSATTASNLNDNRHKKYYLLPLSNTKLTKKTKPIKPEVYDSYHDLKNNLGTNESNLIISSLDDFIHEISSSKIYLYRYCEESLNESCCRCCCCTGRNTTEDHPTSTLDSIFDKCSWCSCKTKEIDSGFKYQETYDLFTKIEFSLDYSKDLKRGLFVHVFFDLKNESIKTSKIIFLPTDDNPLIYNSIKEIKNKYELKQPSKELVIVQNGLILSDEVHREMEND
ncbi:unnamed protein product [Adineta ricciae]|uniref:Uncharacterized protein n=1 Tax=Adineta ricciae TaxID=249248 RepID=A0A815WXS8_ADIRI|nr:unnamed protein product [Adineta ricciae]